MQMEKHEKVAVLGASDKPERYSGKAVALLLAKGHTVYPVNPKGDRVHGLSSYKSLREIPDEIDTVTIYLSPKISGELAADIIAAHPKRVIMNPGAENSDLAAQCERAGINVVHACSLVLLRTDRF